MICFKQLGDEGTLVGDNYNTPMRVHRLRGLWQLGESRAQLRWKLKLGVGTLHFGNNSSSRISINFNVIFDGDH